MQRIYELDAEMTLPLQTVWEMNDQMNEELDALRRDPPDRGNGASGGSV